MNSPFQVDSEIASLELGALFLSALAYPTQKSEAENFRGALIHSAVDSMGAHPETYGAPPEALRLVCKLADRTTVDKLIRKGIKIINSDRLIAAKMGIFELHAYLADKIGIPRPSQVPTHASRDMIAAISLDLDDKKRMRDGRGRKASGGAPEANKGNIIGRPWTRTMPVLHLALALDSFSRSDHALVSPDGVTVGAILFDIKVCKWLIGEAELYRPLVVEKFGVDPATQIHVYLEPSAARGA